MEQLVVISLFKKLWWAVFVSICTKTFLLRFRTTALTAELPISSTFSG